MQTVRTFRKLRGGGRKGHSTSYETHKYPRAAAGGRGARVMGRDTQQSQVWVQGAAAPGQRDRGGENRRECNSAENTNQSIDFCQQVCTTSRNRHAGHKSRGIHKGGGSHEQWTHHLSGIRQGILFVGRVYPSPICLLLQIPPLKPRIIFISATGKSN